MAARPKQSGMLTEQGKREQGPYLTEGVNNTKAQHQNTTLSVTLAAECHWEHFEQESILFNPLSGETHLLTSEAVEIFSVLEESDGDIADALQRISAHFKTAPNHIEDEFYQILEQLEAVGLVEWRRH
jgi:PqqD family protein of HPr-rel-A system